LNTSEQTEQLIHVTFNSFLFGFIDDMYLIVKPYMPSGTVERWRYIELQAQIRMGRADFDLN